MTAKRSSQSNSHLCQFAFADGRQCRMLRDHTHSSLCLFHARQERQFHESQQLGGQLAKSLTGQFLTATDINHVLGKLFSALAQKRITRADAATLAHIGQLLLFSLRYAKHEYKFHYTYDMWQQMIDNAASLPPLAGQLPTSSPAASVVKTGAPADPVVRRKQ